MAEDYRMSDTGQRPRRAVFPWLIAAAFFAFALGMIANPWFEREVRSRLPFTAQVAADEAKLPALIGQAESQVGQLEQLEARLDRIERGKGPAGTGINAGDMGILVQRLAVLEQRLAELDRQSGAALQNAGRAEGMLLVLASRRAIETGQPLGVIEGMLRDRFGGTQPKAVATLVAASQAPVTLAQLQAEMDALAPALKQQAGGSSWWATISSELSNLVSIRHAGAPPSKPADRLAIARTQLHDGNVGAALAQVSRLPPVLRDRASGWIIKARRYVAALEALDMLETVALLQPAPDRDEAVIPLPPADRPEAGSASAPAKDTVGI